jgi:hypothetical protein
MLAQCASAALPLMHCGTGEVEIAESLVVELPSVITLSMTLALLWPRPPPRSRA